MTDEKLKEALDKSQGFYKSLFESALDVVTVVNELGLVLYQNPAIENCIGYTPREIIGTKITDLIHPEDLNLAQESMQSTISQSKNRPKATVRLRHKNGSWCWVEVSIQSLKDSGVDAVLLQSRDISEQRQTLDELMRSDELFKAAFNATSAISAFTHPETGEFIEVNDAFVEMLGWSRDEAIGRTASEMNTWGSDKARYYVLEELKKNGFVRQFRSHFRTKSGEEKTVLIDAKVVHLKDGDVSFISGIDITEREAMEERLRHTQKLESVGLLTGGIAHDFNNLLSVILGQAELASFENISEDTRLSLIAINHAAKSGAQLIQQLLAFSRKQALSPEIFVPFEKVEGMRTLLETTLGKNISLNINPDSLNWHCHIDPIQFESAMLNMAINARDAMPQGGSLSISQVQVPRDSSLIDQHGLQNIDYVQIDISDTGMGIPATIIAHVFEPFYTTKSVSNGSGLGLSMVFGFIKQSGGHIAINSNSTGTTLSLFLPRSDLCAAQNGDNNIKEQSNHSSLRVLLVEDNEGVRELTSRLLQMLGHEVFEAADSMDVESYQGQVYDLLVADVMLPGNFKGPDIAKKLIGEQAGIAVLFVSGFQEGLLLPDDLGSDRVAFIQKPFSIKEFSAKIDELFQE